MNKKISRKYLWARLIFFFSIIGPGIIAANADNDAGGISTYSIVGAEFGTKMIWVLFLLTFLSCVISLSFIIDCSNIVANCSLVTLLTNFLTIDLTMPSFSACGTSLNFRITSPFFTFFSTTEYS